MISQSSFCKRWLINFAEGKPTLLTLALLPLYEGCAALIERLSLRTAAEATETSTKYDDATYAMVIDEDLKTV